MRGLRGFSAGQVAVITGGAAGLGRGLAAALAAGGLQVVLLDIDGEAAAATAADLSADLPPGASVEARAVDVADGAAMTRALQEIVDRHGRLDVMINNAGYSVNGEIQHIDDATWRRVTEVNLLGVVHGSRAAAAHMIAAGRGRVINVASIFGLVSAPLAAPYVATKHAVAGFTEALSHELEGLGVQVHLICPGFIDTGFFDRAAYVGVDREALRRQGEPPKISVEAAVAHILSGVGRGRRRVVFPASARIYLWLDRWAPWLLRRLYRRALADHRRR